MPISLPQPLVKALIVTATVVHCLGMAGLSDGAPILGIENTNDTHSGETDSHHINKRDTEYSTGMKSACAFEVVATGGIFPIWGFIMKAIGQFTPTKGCL